MSGETSSPSSAISRRIAAQSQPSTPPVLNVRFLPYMSGRGRICGRSYSAAITATALGRAYFHAISKVCSVPPHSSTLSAPPRGRLRITSGISSGETHSAEGMNALANFLRSSRFSHMIILHGDLIFAHAAAHSPTGPAPRTSTVSPSSCPEIRTAQ